MNIKIKLTRSANATYHGVNVGKEITLDIEEYLKGVVPSEMYASWNAEALKAQAIAARTYGIFHGAGTKSIDDTTQYQAYNTSKIDSRTNNAVQATKGMVLTYNGKIIDAVFSKSNGGRCRSPKEAGWSTNYPYLPSQDDPWTKASGQAKDGHGVGLSQYGAQYAANNAGKTYQEILAFYFPGTTIAQNYNGSGGSTGGDTGSSDLVGKTGTVVVNSAGLNVRDNPHGNLLSYKLYNGEKVTILEVKAKDGYTWYRVKDSQGRTNGWVRSDFITIDTSSGGSTGDYATWQDKYGSKTFVNSNSYSGNVYRFQTDLNKWLSAHGKTTITADGKWGSKSSEATLLFQQAYSDLTNDGKAGPKTKEKLFNVYGK